MKNFIVISSQEASDNLAGIKDRVGEKYKDYSYEIIHNVWAVSVLPDKTASDIVETLDLGEHWTGVVVEIGSYDGYFDVALWNKLKAWALL